MKINFWIVKNENKPDISFNLQTNVRYKKLSLKFPLRVLKINKVTKC